MSISSEINRVDYTGDGSTTVFAYPFKIFAATDIDAYLGPTLKALTSDYTVSGVGSDVGGNVTFLSAPSAAIAIALIRAVPLTQPADFVAGDALPAQTLEDAFDRLTILCQQLKQAIDRAATAAPYSLLFPSLAPVLFATLPAASTAKGSIAVVTDSTVNVWGSTIAGSGSFTVLAFSNGTNWTVAGA